MNSDVISECLEGVREYRADPKDYAEEGPALDVLEEVMGAVLQALDTPPVPEVLPALSALLAAVGRVDVSEVRAKRTRLAETLSRAGRAEGRRTTKEIEMNDEDEFDLGGDGGNRLRRCGDTLLGVADRLGGDDAAILRAVAEEVAWIADKIDGGG